MSQMILWETDYLLSCFLLGIFLAMLYDVLIIARIVLPRKLFIIGIEDAIYWLVVAVAVFVLLYKGNDGIIRWYAIAAVAAAMFLFNLCVSRFVVPFIGGLLRTPIDFIGKVLKRAGKKFKIMLSKVKRRWFHGRKNTKKKAEKKEKE